MDGSQAVFCHKGVQQRILRQLVHGAAGRLLPLVQPGIGDLCRPLGHDKVMRSVQGKNLSSNNESHPVAMLRRVQHIVGGQQDGFSPVLLLQNHIFHQAAVGGVKTAGGLVQKQKLGVMQQCFYKIQAAFHPLGVVRYPLVRVVFQSHCGKQLRDGAGLPAVERGEELYGKAALAQYAY